MNSYPIADSVGPFGRLNPDPGQTFRAVFTQDIKAKIVEALKRAYNIVQEKHDRSEGYNVFTFGHNVYHIGYFQIQKLCQNAKLERVEELRMLVRFKLQDFTLGLYKVGSSANDNIWESFPNSENGAMSVDGEGAPILLGLEDAMLDRVDLSRYAVIAHLGNAIDGLCAVYLCIPIETSNGKIIRWGYAEQLYLAPAASIPGTNTLPLGGTVVPEEQIPPASPQAEPVRDVVVKPKKA